MAMASQSTAWSDLLPELLGKIAACCPKPADRARFAAVCRSWHLAVRHHCPRTPLRPWVVLPDGSFLTLSDGERHLPSAVLPYGVFVKPSGGGLHRLQLPENTCIGSTGGWLALHRKPSSGANAFLLHNPFSDTTVPLPDVDAISARAPDPRVFRVSKVLMHSTASDNVVVVMTESRHYPFVLSQPGRGTWTPEPLTPPFMYIVDVAFLGDQLYGITKAEDLFALDLVLHQDQVPAISDYKRVIRHPLDSFGYDYLSWSDVDEDYDDDDGVDELPLSENEEDEGYDDDEEELYFDLEYELDTENQQLARDSVPTKVDCWFEEEELPRVEIITIRYLVESYGKLIMVRRQLRMPNDLPSSTRKVEVFEADTDAGAWTPVGGGLGDRGQALFISKRFSKCVYSSEYGEGELDEDAIYFIDTGEVST